MDVVISVCWHTFNMATVRWQLEWPWLQPRLRAEEKMVAWWSMKNVSNLFFLSRFLISNLCTTLLVSYLDCRLIPHLLSPIIAMCYCELYYSTSLTWPWLKYIILKSNIDHILHCCNASDWGKSRKKPTQDSNLYPYENQHGNAIWLHSKCKRNFLLKSWIGCFKSYRSVIWTISSSVDPRFTSEA